LSGIKATLPTAELRAGLGEAVKRGLTSDPVILDHVLAEPADPAHGPQRGASHEQLRWVGLAETEALPWLSADLPVLASIRAVHHFHDADRSFVTS